MPLEAIQMYLHVFKERSAEIIDTLHSFERNCIISFVTIMPICF